MVSPNRNNSSSNTRCGSDADGHCVRGACALRLTGHITRRLQLQKTRIVVAHSSSHCIKLGPHPTLTRDVRTSTFVDFRFSSSPTHGRTSKFAACCCRGNTSGELTGTLGGRLGGLPLAGHNVRFNSFLIVHSGAHPTILYRVNCVGSAGSFGRVGGTDCRRGVTHSVTGKLGGCFGG